MQRQGYGEGAALAGLRRHADPPTMGLHQNAADIETKAETRRLAVHPVKPIEQMWHVFRVDSRTRILNGNPCLTLPLLDSDDDLARLGTVLEGIADQVLQHLLEANMIPCSIN